MTEYGDIEAKMMKIKQCRDIEQAVDHCQRGVLNQGIIYKIAAESDYGSQRGGAERSIDLVLTIDESAKVFELVGSMIAERLKTTRAELGL